MKLLRLRPMQANVAVAVVGMLRQEAAGTQQAVHRTARPSSRASTRGHTSCTQLAGPDDGSILTLSAVQRRPGDLFKALGTEGPAEVRGFLLADRACCFVIRKAPCACESPEAWIQATLSRTWCLGTSEQQCRIACRSSCRRGMPTPRGLTYCDATPADELTVWLHDLAASAQSAARRPGLRLFQGNQYLASWQQPSTSWTAVLGAATCTGQVA